MPEFGHYVDRRPGSFVEEKKYSSYCITAWLSPNSVSGWQNELVSMLEAMLAETELRASRGRRPSSKARVGPIRVKPGTSPRRPAGPGFSIRRG